MHKKKPEIRLVLFSVLAFFAVFLAAPLGVLLITSLKSAQGIDFSNYISVLQDKSVIKAIGNSVNISAFAALITTVLAFILAYTVNFTQTANSLKSLIRMGIVVPDAVAVDYLWVCHHLFFWQAGIADKTVWG